MKFNPDAMIYWQWGFVKLNATIVYSWSVMGILLLVSWLATRRLSSGVRFSRWQNFMEAVVSMIRDQIRDVSRQDPAPYLPFIGTIFLFIALANLLAVVPGYLPPTASLSTTVALAGSVFVAVPIYGIQKLGVLNYLKQYTRPTVLMLPFNIIGEISRTIAMAVRLFGNMMSGMVVVAVLLTIAPFLFPILLQLLGLLIGMIQAYIFAVLAMVYISSAVIVHGQAEPSAGSAKKSTAQEGGE